MAFLNDEAVYIQNNARSHIVTIVFAVRMRSKSRDYWPPRSSDLNPIQHYCVLLFLFLNKMFNKKKDA